MLCIVLSVCGCSGSQTPSTTAFEGYWRGSVSALPHLVFIQRADDRYSVEAPPSVWARGLDLRSDSLVIPVVQHAVVDQGRVIIAQHQSGQIVLTLDDAGQTLVWKQYVGSPPYDRPPVGVLRLTRATGSVASLASELHGWLANAGIPGQVSALSSATDAFAHRFGRLPKADDLRPGALFWTWRHAPHLSNLVSGGVMARGSAPGDFTFTADPLGGYAVSIHLYGGGEVTQTEAR